MEVECFCEYKEGFFLKVLEQTCILYQVLLWSVDLGPWKYYQTTSHIYFWCGGFEHVGLPSGGLIHKAMGIFEKKMPQILWVCGPW